MHVLHSSIRLYKWKIPLCKLFWLWHMSLLCIVHRGERIEYWILSRAVVAKSSFCDIISWKSDRCCNFSTDFVQLKVLVFEDRRKGVCFTGSRGQFSMNALQDITSDGFRGFFWWDNQCIWKQLCFLILLRTSKWNILQRLSYTTCIQLLWKTQEQMQIAHAIKREAENYSPSLSINSFFFCFLQICKKIPFSSLPRLLTLLSIFWWQALIVLLV